MKECTVCHQVKPLEAFHFKNKAKGTRCSACAECRNARSRAERAKDPDATRRYYRAYWKNNPDFRLRENLRKQVKYWANHERELQRNKENYRKRRDRCTCTN